MTTGVERTRHSRGIWRDALGRILRNRPATVGLAIVTMLVVAAASGPLVVPYGPLDADLSRGLQTPTLSHLMGTDQQGRDMLSRIVYGARISLTVGITSITSAILIGGLMGAVAGGFGGRIETVVMRVTDILLAVPGILLAIGIVAWLNRGLPQITLAVAVVNAPVFARLLRGSLLRLRQADYVCRWRVRSVAAEHGFSCATCSRTRSRQSSFKRPCRWGPRSSTSQASASLGWGLPDPSTPEWGTMLTNAAALTRSAPYLIIFPGFAIVLTVMGFNLLGDGLREALDPRLKR